MRKALICQPQIALSRCLEADMRSHGWHVDACDSMLEMLRLVERNEYEVVVLNGSYGGMDVHTVAGAIKKLDKAPRIFLNLPETTESLNRPLFLLDYPVIRGILTTEKLLEAVSGPSSGPSC